MFDDLIKNIKSKLPERFRGEDDDDYEDEEFAEDEKTSDIDVKEIMEGEDNDSEDEDDDEEELNEEEEKKKKRSKMIKIGVGLVVAFLAIDEFFLKEEPAPPPVVKKKKKKKRRKKKKNRKERAAEKLAKEKPAKEQSIVKKSEPKIEATPVPTPEPVVEATPEPIIEATPEPIATQEPTLGEEIKIDPTPIVEDAKPSLEDIASKIEAPKLEYVEPPNYEQFGRGLVYNCKGKHWACVDKAAFLSCKQNQKWSDENQKGYECKTSNIYATDKDCRVMQVHNINTIQDTSFCNSK